VTLAIDGVGAMTFGNAEYVSRPIETGSIAVYLADALIL